MKLYKYKNQTIEASSHQEACNKLGISLQELKKNGKILRYLKKLPKKNEVKTRKKNFGYEEKQLKRRLGIGQEDKNWHVKWIIKQLKENGCAICGYDKSDHALCFHHVEPSLKEFELRVGRLRIKGLTEEVAKCMCLCLNCHAEIHEIMENEYDKEREKKAD